MKTSLTLDLLKIVWGSAYPGEETEREIHVYRQRKQAKSIDKLTPTEHLQLSSWSKRVVQLAKVSAAVLGLQFAYDNRGIYFITLLLYIYSFAVV